MLNIQKTVYFSSYACEWRKKKNENKQKQDFFFGFLDLVKG